MPDGTHTLLPRRTSTLDRKPALTQFLDEYLAWQAESEQRELQRRGSAGTLVVDWDGTGDVKVRYRNPSEENPTQPSAQTQSLQESLQGEQHQEHVFQSHASHATRYVASRCRVSPNGTHCPRTANWTSNLLPSLPHHGVREKGGRGRHDLAYLYPYLQCEKHNQSHPQSHSAYRHFCCEPNRPIFYGGCAPWAHRRCFMRCRCRGRMVAEKKRKKKKKRDVVFEFVRRVFEGIRA